MTVLTYPSNSPYAGTPQTSWYLGRWIFRPIPANSGDTLYTLDARHAQRPDLLSYELYTTPNYWWVFAIRNPFLRADPIWDFVAGIKIVVPSAQYLRTVVGT